MEPSAENGQKKERSRPRKKNTKVEANNSGANIYEAAADRYFVNSCIDEELLKTSPYHVSNIKGHKRILLDPLAPDYRDLFVDKGTVTAPDEVLHMLRPSPLQIPIKFREDFDTSETLPDSDLLRAIHYYASNSEMDPRLMDETALLAMGMLVESWAEDELEVLDPSIFLDPDPSVDLQKFAPPLSDTDNSDFGKDADERIKSEASSSDSSDSDGSDSDESSDSSEHNTEHRNGDDKIKDDSDSRHSSNSDSDSSIILKGKNKEEDKYLESESDIMSVDLSESDTATEVEGGRHFKRRRISQDMGSTGSSETEKASGKSSSTGSSSADSESSNSSDSGSSDSSSSDSGSSDSGSSSSSGSSGSSSSSSSSSSSDSENKKENSNNVSETSQKPSSELVEPENHPDVAANDGSNEKQEDVTEKVSSSSSSSEDDSESDSSSEDE